MISQQSLVFLLHAALVIQCAADDSMLRSSCAEAPNGDQCIEAGSPGQAAALLQINSVKPLPAVVNDDSRENRVIAREDESREKRAMAREQPLSRTEKTKFDGDDHTESDNNEENANSGDASDPEVIGSNEETGEEDNMGSNDNSASDEDASGMHTETMKKRQERASGPCQWSSEERAFGQHTGYEENKGI